MYASISSSPSTSSSSKELGAGEGVDSDCRLDDSIALAGLAAGELDEPADRDAGSDILGASILIDLDGDRARRRECLCPSLVAAAELEEDVAIDAVDDLRSPAKEESASLVFLDDDGGGAAATLWRDTRETDCGEERTELRFDNAGGGEMRTEWRILV